MFAIVLMQQTNFTLLDTYVGYALIILYMHNSLGLSVIRVLLLLTLQLFLYFNQFSILALAQINQIIVVNGVTQTLLLLQLGTPLQYMISIMEPTCSAPLVMLDGYAT